MNKIINFLFWGMLSLGSAVSAQNKQLALDQDLVAKAFVHQDSTAIRQVFSPAFSLAGSTGEGAERQLNQVLRFYKIKLVALKSLSNKKDVKHLEFQSQHGKTVQSEVWLDGDGKIKRIVGFDQLFGMIHREKATLKAVIPFENKNGSIYLSVRINNFPKPLRLLFDTGADGMAISESLASEMGLKITRENNASVVGGNHQIKVSDNNSVWLDSIQIDRQGIAVFPTIGHDADGIIGNTLLQRFIAEINYDKNTLSLYDFGTFQYPKQGIVIPFKMPAGVMMLSGALEIVSGKKYDGQFIFDTGAAYDLICFRPFVRQNRLLVSGFKPEVQASTVSMGISSPTFTGTSFQFALQGLPAQSLLPVTLMGGTSQNEKWQPGADGSLGVRLLSRYNMIINMSKNEIFFSPNQRGKQPQDFVLKNYLFGWDGDGILRLQSSIGLKDLPSGLHLNEEIKSINAIDAKMLKNNPNKISELRLNESLTIEVNNGQKINGI